MTAEDLPGARAQSDRAIEISFGPRARQRRFFVLFRLLLALPGAFALGCLGVAIFLIAIFDWFAALALGHLPS